MSLIDPTTSGFLIVLPGLDLAATDSGAASRPPLADDHHA